MLEALGTLTVAPFTGPQDRNLDRTVLFRCGDRAAVRNPRDPDQWYDVDFANEFPFVQYDAFGGAACGSRDDIAMTVNTRLRYDEGTRLYPHHVVYLCDAAFAVPSTIGTAWRTELWKGAPIDDTGSFLSATILHELLHVQDGKSFGLPCKSWRFLGRTVANCLNSVLTGNLPSRNGKTEVYSWREISQLSDDDKLANAESYTLLATGECRVMYQVIVMLIITAALYLKRNTISVVNGEMSRRFSRNNRPGNSPNDGHQ